MKQYLVYWTSAYGGGHVLVNIGEDVSNPTKLAMNQGMSKAFAVCQTAEFLKLEEIPLTKSGVVWINEWFD